MQNKNLQSEANIKQNPQIELSNEFYSKLGFKCGIEIHQQLNTKKLFCNCSSQLNEKNEIFVTKRNIRPTEGELGKIDIAGVFEHLRNRTFFYHAYENEACLIDIDEEPPLQINHEALYIALQVAKLFKLKIPDYLCVMRKGIFDGSSPFSFQRTILIGIETPDSLIETTLGKVKITQLNLEEDAAKILSQNNNTTHSVHYSLSRLGIPLLEISTDSSIKSPAHAYETAKEIGTILRSFNVKRGLGTIRQDINISISEGERIEVKGWQDLRRFKQLIENEVSRHLSLIEIKKHLLNKKTKEEDFKHPQEVTHIFKHTSSMLIKRLLTEKRNVKIFALCLPNFAGLLKKELCKNKTFGKELLDYAVAYGIGGIIHSDEDLSKYSLTKEFEALSIQLNSSKDDAIVILCGEENLARKTINVILERAKQCLKGIPKETRIPNHETATTSFSRPLPGSARMYPETDINLIETKPIIKDIILPKLIKEKIYDIEKQYKLSPELARLVVGSSFDFEYFVREFKNIEPRFIAHTLVEIPKELVSRYNIKESQVQTLSEEHFFRTLKLLSENKIAKEAVIEILKDFATGKKIEILNYAKPDYPSIKKELEKIISQHKELSINALMGIAMKQFRGKIDGKKLMELLQDILHKEKQHN